jgi:ribosomal protein S18 acetylase RimI-like enzyme
MAALPSGMDDFPSHLHVNLLPSARGGGQGARLLADFFDGLAHAGSPGVHVRVGHDNPAALRFYERLGFTPHSHDTETAVLVRRIDGATAARG